MSNLPKSSTNMPVALFEAQTIPEHIRVGGLLDYGYTIGQVAKMLGVKYDYAEFVMRRHGFEEVVAPTTEPTRLEGGESESV